MNQAFPQQRPVVKWGQARVNRPRHGDTSPHNPLLTRLFPPDRKKNNEGRGGRRTPQTRIRDGVSRRATAGATRRRRSPLAAVCRSPYFPAPSSILLLARKEALESLKWREPLPFIFPRISNRLRLSLCVPVFFFLPQPVFVPARLKRGKKGGGREVVRAH